MAVLILSEGSGGINLTVKNQVRGTFQAEGEEYTGPKAGEAMKEKKKKSLWVWIWITESVGKVVCKRFRERGRAMC